jgi:hypothetical protein
MGDQPELKGSMAGLDQFEYSFHGTATSYGYVGSDELSQDRLSTGARVPVALVCWCQLQ